ncbi:MAG: sugar kinase [Actinomycetota bacterium]|nr:sugar kinase [Actinomycetota bacterium]
MTGAPTVVVVGDAGLDIVARHAVPIVGGADIRARIEQSPGGAGANTAAWLAHLGGDPMLVARVGDDTAGTEVLAELTASGVRCAFAVDPVAPTCRVVVLVEESGQRTMLSDRGANAWLRGDDLDPALLSSARHLHLSGYVLLDESSRQAGLDVLAAARTAGISTSVDPQAAPMIHDRVAFLDAVHGVDLLLPNMDELAALTGSTDPESARALLDDVGVVAVTDGAAGAYWVTRDVIEHVPAPEVDVVDSTGAGDAFDAGLLIAWLAGATPREALTGGVTAGSAAVRRVGARPPQPSIT